MADLLTSLSEFTMVKLTKTWEEQAFPHVWKKSQFYHCLHGQVKIRGQSCLDFSAAADTAVTMDWGAHSLWFASGGKLTQRGEDVFRQLSHTSQGKGEMMEEYNDVFWSTVNGREKDRKGLERAHKDDWEANRPLWWLLRKAWSLPQPLGVVQCPACHTAIFWGTHLTIPTTRQQGEGESWDAPNGRKPFLLSSEQRTSIGFPPALLHVVLKAQTYLHIIYF